MFISLSLSLSLFYKYYLSFQLQEPGPKYHSRRQIFDNQIDLVKLLVGNGSKVTVCDNNDDTPYDAALQCDFYDCAQLLSELASKCCIH